MSKSLKSAYFRHIFANNFFWCIFSKLFQQIRNQREILRFLMPILKQKNFLLFLYTSIANAQETAQKKEIFFYECVLEFSYATIKRFA
jgi:hypothetical protein